MSAVARGGQRGFEVFTARADARERGDPVVFGQVRCHMKVRAGAYYKAVGSMIANSLERVQARRSHNLSVAGSSPVRPTCGYTSYPARNWRSGSLISSLGLRIARRA